MASGPNIPGRMQQRNPNYIHIVQVPKGYQSITPYAVMHVKHDYLIITGVKFINRKADTIYRFKKEEGLWNICWTQDK